MGILKRTTDKAMTDAANHATKAAELEAKAVEAEATARQLDTDSLTTLVDDPEQAETVAGRISAQERLARAYRAKAAEYRALVERCHREALELEAADLDERAAKLDVQADKVVAKVAAALAALEEADGGHVWARGGADVSENQRALGQMEYTRTVTTQEQRAEGGAAAPIREQAKALRLRAGHNRYFLQHGRLAGSLVDLGGDQGGPLDYLVGIIAPTVEDSATTDLLARLASGVGEPVPA